MYFITEELINLKEAFVVLIPNVIQPYFYYDFIEWSWNALIFHKQYKLIWCPLVPPAAGPGPSPHSLSLSVSQSPAGNHKLWLGAKDNLDILNFINQSAKENGNISIGPPALRYSSMWEDRCSGGQPWMWVCQYKQALVRLIFQKRE